MAENAPRHLIALAFQVRQFTGAADKMVLHREPIVIPSARNPCDDSNAKDFSTRCARSK